MNKLIKKIAAVGISAILLFALSACGSDKEDSSYSSTPTPTPVAANNNGQTIAEDSQDDYLSCIKITNDIAYFDMTIDEFITTYNTIIENSSKNEGVKDFMMLNPSPTFVSATEDGADIYDVTNPVVATNRNVAVQTTISTLHGTSNVLSVNIVVPNSAGSNTDITEEVALVSLALVGEEGDQASSIAYNNLRSNGAGYCKGLFMGYYNQNTAEVYRIGAMTEDSYNQIK